MIYCFQVAGIILAAIFLVHGLLAVGFKVQCAETFFPCVATKSSLNFSVLNGLAQNEESNFMHSEHVLQCHIIAMVSAYRFSLTCSMSRQLTSCDS